MGTCCGALTGHDKGFLGGTYLVRPCAGKKKEHMTEKLITKKDIEEFDDVLDLFRFFDLVDACGRFCKTVEIRLENPMGNYG